MATFIAPRMGKDAGAGHARMQEASSLDQRAGSVANQRDGFVDGCVAYQRDGCVAYLRDGCVAYQRDGCVAYQRDGCVAYQRDAVLRVVLPQGRTVTDLHCDADYHHPPWELNWSELLSTGCHFRWPGSLKRHFLLFGSILCVF